MLKNTTAQSAIFDPRDPNAFSYDAAALDVKRKKELAKQLMDFQMRNGGITNQGGFYAGGATGLDAVLKGLTAYLGTTQQAGADQDAKALDRSSQEAYRAAMNQMQTPSAQELSLAQDPAVFQHRNPESVGPQMDPAAFAQTSPVRSGDVQSTPLPRGSVSPGVGGGRSAGIGGPTAEQLATIQSPGPAAPVQPGINLGPANAATAGRPMRQAQMQPALAQAMAAQGQVQPQPQMPAPVQQALPVQPPVQETPQPEQSPFVVNKDALAGVMAERQKLQRDRVSSGEDALQRSGPRGQALLAALQAAEMQRLAKGKGEESFTLGEGQTRFDANGRPIASVGASTNKRESQNVENRIKIDGLLTEANTELNGNVKVLKSVDVAREAITKYAPKFGGLLGKARLAAGLAAGENDAVEFNNALQGLSLDSLKATFGGNTSNTELLELGKQWGSDGSVPAATLLRKLDQIAEAAARGKKNYEGRVTNLKKEYGLAGGTVEEDVPTSAPQINGVPTYQRGQTIRPQ